MTLNPESKYPRRRAYVLKVRSDAKPDALPGRFENLVTGQQREFASGQGLPESIRGARGYGVPPTVRVTG
jgi:hypothetical protein